MVVYVFVHVVLVVAVAVYLALVVYGGRIRSPLPPDSPCPFPIPRYDPAMHIIAHVVILALTVLVLSRVTSGVWLRHPVSALGVAVVFSLLNLALGWLLRLLLVVPTILTLGLLLLFTSFIVNTVLLWLADKLLASFELKSLRALFISSGAITIVNWLFHFPRWR